MIDQLTAGGTIDPRAQFGNAIFVGILHVRLPRDEPCQHIIAEGEIGRSRSRPDPEQRDGSDRNPEYDRAKPNLSAAMSKSVTAPLFPHSRRQASRCRVARRMSIMIVSAMRRVLGTLTGTVRHRYSCADLKQASGGSTSMLI